MSTVNELNLLKVIKRTTTCIFAMVLMALNTSVAGAKETTAHTLDDVPGKISSPRGRADFLSQMAGEPSTEDGLGTHLPAEIPAVALLSTLAPGVSQDKVALLGSRKLREPGAHYVAIACLVTDSRDRKEIREYYEGQPGCSPFITRLSKRPLRIILAVIDRTSAGSLSVMARIEWMSDKPGPLDSHWTHSAVEPPSDAEDFRTNQLSHILPPEEITRFDLARYEVISKSTAIGLRSIYREPYPGGGGNWEILTLFLREGNRLVPILTEPLYHFAMYGGDWNPDGTREHPIVEESAVVRVLKSTTAGYHDLEITRPKPRWRKRMVWTPECTCYQRRPELSDK